MNNAKVVLYGLLACATAILAVRGLPDFPDPLHGLACLLTGAVAGYPYLTLAFEHAELGVLKRT